MAAMAVALMKPPPPPSQRVSQNLHIFYDKSVMRKMSVKDLIRIPIWKGNRLLCEDHKRQIQESLKGGPRPLELKPYHIITYPVADDDGHLQRSSFIIDGQHRVSILKDVLYQTPDLEPFDCIVIEKECSTETEAIDYFRILNMTRAVEWKHDPNLLANAFVKGVEKEFNTGKLCLIRPAGSHRPYLSADKLREAILKRRFEEGKSVEEFVAKIRELNKAGVQRLREVSSRSKMEQKALELGFTLALDEKFRWLGLV
jgi:hypothetical protein